MFAPVKKQNKTASLQISPRPWAWAASLPMLALCPAPWPSWNDHVDQQKLLLFFWLSLLLLVLLGLLHVVAVIV